MKPPDEPARVSVRAPAMGRARLGSRGRPSRAVRGASAAEPAPFYAQTPQGDADGRRGGPQTRDTWPRWANGAPPVKPMQNLATVAIGMNSPWRRVRRRTSGRLDRGLGPQRPHTVAGSGGSMKRLTAHHEVLPAPPETHSPGDWPPYSLPVMRWLRAADVQTDPVCLPTLRSSRCSTTEPRRPRRSRYSLNRSSCQGSASLW